MHPRSTLAALVLSAGCAADTETDDAPGDTDTPPGPTLADDAAWSAHTNADLHLVGSVGSEFYTFWSTQVELEELYSARWTDGASASLDDVGGLGPGELMVVSDAGVGFRAGATGAMAWLPFTADGEIGAPTATIDAAHTPSSRRCGLVGRGDDQMWVFLGASQAVAWSTIRAGALGSPDFTLADSADGWTGDVTGDGAPDLITAPADAPERLHLFGAPLPLGQGAWSGATAVLDVGDVHVLAVSDAGDFTGDGEVDWVVSGALPDGATRSVWVLPGPIVGPVTLSDAVLRIDGTEVDAWGAAIAALGDVDGDGRDDFAVGAPGHRHNDRVFGAERAGNELGRIDDLDQDGVHDLIVMAPGMDAPAGYDDDTDDDRMIDAWIYAMSGADLAAW